MTNTTPASRRKHPAIALAAAMGLAAALGGPPAAATATNLEPTTMNASQALTQKQQSIAPIAATMAIGDLPGLNAPSTKDSMQASQSATPRNASAGTYCQ
jgi:hypothetical protein